MPGKENKDKWIRTNISQAFWFGRKHTGEYDFIPARQWDPGRKQKREICWFDRLFKSGIRIPQMPSGERRAVTLLLTGPPGTGKSTLATEICYRTALSLQNPKNSLYLTTEAFAPWLKENARAMWGDDIDSVFENSSSRKKGSLYVHSISSADGIDTRPTENKEKYSRITETVEWLLGLNECVPSATKNSRDSPDILVVDSLNTMQEAERGKAIQRFWKFIQGGPELAILVLDALPDSEFAQMWEYQCDIVVRLNRTYPQLPSDYMLRTIEIVKARYQEHVWGPHQVKIYPKGADDLNLPSKNPDHESFSKLQLSHPYRSEGGIFIYPSIHYLLSEYKRSPEPFPAAPAALAIHSMESMFDGEGFPKGRCTAFVGKRGGHKSHLGFMQVLAGIRDVLSSNKTVADNKIVEKAIVVSLRDDQATTRKTMQGILKHWGHDIELEELERKDILEILHFAPGYITPEEFLHRLLLSIYRLKSVVKKRKQVHISLLFNSLDQLGARFPLCAKEDIFIAGMTQILSSEGVTSYFAAAEEDGEQGSGFYGIESIAELIIDFSQTREYSNKAYLRAAIDSIPSKLLPSGKVPEKDRKHVPGQLEQQESVRSCVKATIVRHAGGQAAGGHGILTLLKEGDPLFEFSKPYFSLGLNYFPVNLKQ